LAEKKSTLLSLFDLEKIGRELATALQTAEPSEGVTVVLHEKIKELINEHRELIDEVYDVVKKLGETGSEYGGEPWESVDEKLWDMMDNLSEYVAGLKRLAEKIESGEYVFKPEDNAPIYVNNALKNYMGHIDDIIWDLADHILTYYTLPEDLGMKIHRIRDKVIELNKERKEISYFNKYIRQMHEINKYIRKIIVETPPNLAVEINNYLDKVMDYMEHVNMILSDKLYEIGEKIIEKLGKHPSDIDLEKCSDELCKKYLRIDEIRIAALIIKNVASAIKMKLYGVIDIQAHHGVRAIKVPDLKNYKISVVENTNIGDVLVGAADTGYEHAYNPSIRSLFRYVSKNIGRKVGYMVWYFDKLSVPALINDLANAVHVLAEELSKLGIEPKYWKHGKCEALEEADERLIKLCTYWDKYTDYNYREGMYIDEDYEALFAELMRDRGEFRVGSAEGHATEVTIRDNTIRIRYYDYDHDVNHYIRQDFEECGLTCKELDDGVECEGTYTGEGQLKCIASTMAEATSMDIRLRGY